MTSSPTATASAPPRRIDALAKVTGAATYAADISRPGTLWAKALRSPHPHARIVRIDASRALARKGVLAVITGFLAGAAVDVVIGELPKLTGTDAEGKNAWRELGAWIGSLGDVHAATVLVGAAALALILGLRFTGDRVVPGERFETLRRELGDSFVGVEIDSSPGNRWGIPSNAHSVLTEHLVDEVGHPTRDALDQVLDLFRERLLAR